MYVKNNITTIPHRYDGCCMHAMQYTYSATCDALSREKTALAHKFSLFISNCYVRRRQEPQPLYCWQFIHRLFDVRSFVDDSTIFYTHRVMERNAHIYSQIRLNTKLTSIQLWIASKDKNKHAVVNIWTLYFKSCACASNSATKVCKWAILFFFDWMNTKVSLECHLWSVLNKHTLRFLSNLSKYLSRIFKFVFVLMLMSEKNSTFLHESDVV